MQHSIIVTGAPGAGKTTLVANLAKQLTAKVALGADGLQASQAIDAGILAGQGIQMVPDAQASDDRALVEHCAYGSGWNGMAGTLIVVMDAVPLSQKKPDLTEADLYALGCADLVVISRTDLVQEARARAQLAQMTNASVHAATFGALDRDVLPPQNPREIALIPKPKPEVWSYSGGANLDQALAEALLKRRPSGTLRIKGHVIAGEAGLRLDQTGRARSVTPCAAPEESLLFAAGTKGTFREHDMAVHFAETVTSGAATSGWFGFR